MQPGAADLGRVDDAAVDAGGIVRILVEVGDIVGEGAGLDQQVAAGQVADRPTRRSKLNASVKAARSMKDVKRELVSSSSDWKVLCWPTVSPTRLRRAVGQDGVDDLDPVVGEIELEHIAEAAGNRPLDAEPGAAQLVREAEARDC